MKVGFSGGSAKSSFLISTKTYIKIFITRLGILMIVNIWVSAVGTHSFGSRPHCFVDREGFVLIVGSLVEFGFFNILVKWPQVECYMENNTVEISDARDQKVSRNCVYGAGRCCFGRVATCVEPIILS